VRARINIIVILQLSSFVHLNIILSSFIIILIEFKDRCYVLFDGFLHTKELIFVAEVRRFLRLDRLELSQTLSYLNHVLLSEPARRYVHILVSVFENRIPFAIAVRLRVQLGEALLIQLDSRLDRHVFVLVVNHDQHVVRFLALGAATHLRKSVIAQVLLLNYVVVAFTPLAKQLRLQRCRHILAIIAVVESLSLFLLNVRVFVQH